MAAANLPTPPIGAPGSSTSITDNPYVLLAEMAYGAWRPLCLSQDTRQTAISVSSNYSGDANAIISATAHGLAVSDQVAFTGTVIPTGLAADTLYYVKTVNSTTSFEVSATDGGTVITMSAADFTAGTFYPSNFAGMPADWAALVVADSNIADRWLREISYAYANPGITPGELYRAEAENAVKLGWRNGTLNTSTKLSPYVDYSYFEGATVTTPLRRGFESLPAIEQARFEMIVAITTANQSRLGEVARRFGVTNGANSEDPNYNAMALVAANGFDPVNQVTRS